MLRNVHIGSPPAQYSPITLVILRTSPANCWSIAHSKRSTRNLSGARNSTDPSSHDKTVQAKPPVVVDPATQFSSLANAFSRRLLVGTTAATAVALGGNLGGITSFLLGFKPETFRKLKLDVVYPVNGYKRYLDTTNGFEFIYPAAWVGDQRLLYRAVERAEMERLFDLPRMQDTVRPQQTMREPIAAFGPPGSNGELNVSVIVAQVPTNFMIEKFGDPTQAGEVILSKFIVLRSSNITAVLIDAKKKEDYSTNKRITYYNLEYTVQGPTFSRHNVSVYTAFSGRLFTLNAESPESLWPTIKDKFYDMADSFKLVP